MNEIGAFPDLELAPRKPVVVTGVAGFIGSHVAETLLAFGFTVVGIDHCGNAPADIVDRNLAPLLKDPRFTLVRGDLATIPLEPLFTGADTVLHLAARPGVRTSWGTEFVDYCSSNLVATHRLMEAAENAKVRRVVVSSSSSVYGSDTDVALHEEMLPNPLSPYGVTKLATEKLALAHARRPGAQLSVVVLRYFTVYGPRQRADMAISRMIQSALSGDPITLFGDGTQRRDFTFVDDAVRGNLLAMTADTDCAVVNLGTGATISVNELIELVGEIVGRPVPVLHAPAEAGDVPFTHADVSLAEKVLGFRAKTDLRTGIRRQLAWIQENEVARRAN